MTVKNHSLSALLCTIPLLAMAEATHDLDSEKNSPGPITTIPAVPQNLTVMDQTLIACMSHQGLALVDLNEKNPFPVIHDSITAMHIAWMDDHLIVADRSSKLSVYQFPTDNTPYFQDEPRDYNTDSVPVRISVSGKNLAVAGGGSGASFWSFSPETETLNLVSRYPFVEYARDVYFLSQDRVGVADVHGNCIIILDVSDISKPTTIGNLGAGRGFFDRVLTDGNNLLSYKRQGEFLSFPMLDNFSKVGKQQSHSLLKLYPDAGELHINDFMVLDDSVIVLEKNQGLSVMKKNESGNPTTYSKPVIWQRSDNPAIAMTLHPDGESILVATMNGEISRHVLD